MITETRIKQIWHEEHGRAIDLTNDSTSLDRFTFGFNNNKNRVGVTRHDSKRIEFSRTFLHSLDEAQARETMRHELAHAAVGPGHGHGITWRKMARFLGSDGSVAAAGQWQKKEDYLWRIECAVSGDVLGRVNRRGRRLDSSVCKCHNQYPRWIKQR